MNIGLVDSKNAGAASIASAMPVLNEYFISGSFNLAPIAQSDCLSLPHKVKVSRGGVCTVFGACGLTFGKETVLGFGSGNHLAIRVRLELKWKPFCKMLISTTYKDVSEVLFSLAVGHFDMYPISFPAYKSKGEIVTATIFSALPRFAGCYKSDPWRQRERQAPSRILAG